MSTTCYALVRGSAMRVTSLTNCGGFADEVGFVATRSVAKVTINEVSEGGSNEVLRNDEGELRLHFVQSAQTIRYTADLDFTRTDPGLLSLLSGQPVVENAAGDIVGFDVNTRTPAVSFAMELWSKLDRGACDGLLSPGSFGEGGFGEGGFGVSADGENGRKWGYTLFPYLRGGYISGVTFDQGLVSFSLRGASVQRNSRWGVGPYDLIEPGSPLFHMIEPNTRFRQIILPAQPPANTVGVEYFSMAS